MEKTGVIAIVGRDQISSHLQRYLALFSPVSIDYLKQDQLHRSRRRLRGKSAGDIHRHCAIFNANA